MKTCFMLDTNAVRALLERRSAQLDRWFAEERCSISGVVAAELRFGLARRRMSPEREGLVLALLEVLPTQPFDAGAAITYGQLRAELTEQGLVLAAMDLLIASHALAIGHVLISADHVFSQVPQLSCRSWE